MTFVMLRCDRCKRLAEVVVTTGELVADDKQTCGTRPELVCADCSARTTGDACIVVGAAVVGRTSFAFISTIEQQGSQPAPSSAAASPGKGSEGAPSSAAFPDDAPPSTAPGARAPGEVIDDQDEVLDVDDDERPWGMPHVALSKDTPESFAERRRIILLLWKWSQENQIAIRDAGILQRAARMLALPYQDEWCGDRFERKRDRREEIDAWESGR